MKQMRWIKYFLALSAVMLLAAGCGSESESSQGGASVARTTIKDNASPPQPVATKAVETTAAVGDFTRGEALFNTNCTACHAPKGGAKPHLGKDMVHSTFTASQTDKALMTFLKLGRPPGDPLNTTGVGMPPKGGNPALTDDNLKDLIAYIRGLQVTEGIEFK